MSLDFSSDALAGFREDPDVSVARASQDYLSKLGIGTDGFPRVANAKQASARDAQSCSKQSIQPNLSMAPCTESSQQTTRTRTAPHANQRRKRL